MDAELRFTFEHVEGVTHYRAIRQTPPWKVVRGFSQSTGECLIHLNNICGGVFGGDCLRLHGTLQPGATAQVTTTGATRLYRPRNDAAEVGLHAHYHLQAGAVLEYLPDALIPYRGVQATQHTTFTMEHGSTLFAWDTIAPGRVAHGERFCYRRLRLVTEVIVEDVPVLLDRLMLEPQRWPMNALTRFGNASGYLVTLIAVQAGADPRRLRLLESSLNELLADISGPSGGDLWGATMMPSHGVMVRGIASSSLRLSPLLLTLWSHCKRELLGRDAVPPRKLY